MDDIRKSVAEKRILVKSACQREVRDRATRLEVRIEDKLDNREDAARFQDAEQIGERRSTIRYFAKNGYQDCAIEQVGGKPAIAYA